MYDFLCILFSFYLLRISASDSHAVRPLCLFALCSVFLSQVLKVAFPSTMLLPFSSKFCSFFCFSVRAYSSFSCSVSVFFPVWHCLSVSILFCLPCSFFLTFIFFLPELAYFHTFCSLQFFFSFPLSPSCWVFFPVCLPGISVSPLLASSSFSSLCSLFFDLFSCPLPLCFPAFYVSVLA